MKKQLIFLVLVAFFGFSSCSDSDDGAPTSDPILGTWVLKEVIPENIINIDTCSKESTINFFNDNTGSSTFYLSSSNCKPEETEGEWLNLGNSMYSFAIPLMGSQEGSVDFHGEDAFDFSAQGITFRFERKE